MVKRIVYPVAALCLGAIVAYVIFVCIFLVTSLFTARDASKSFEKYKVAGFTPEISREYLDLLPKISKIVKTSESILITPIIHLAGRSETFNQAADLYQSIAETLPALPMLIGEDQPKKYFVAFQNPAEARGTGGLVGAFAIVQLSKGDFEVKQVGSNYLLALQDEMPVKLPAEFKNLYGDHPAWWPNSNMSPHFPYAGKIWLGLWKKQYGDDLDGAIALDPFVLKDILEVTGEVEVRDTKINANNVIKETLFESYLRYRDENESRKEYLVEIIETVMNAAFSSDVNRAELIWSLRDSISENRMLIYSANTSVQKFLERSPISGSLDYGNESEFRLVIQNTAGNKMDYYITREVELIRKTCGKNGITQARIKISNSAPVDLDLPDNYFGRTDKVDKSNPFNSTSVAALLYGAKGARVAAAYDVTNDRAVGYLKKERGRQILVVPLDLKAGESREVLVDFQGFPSMLDSYQQPLVIPQKTVIRDKCR
jgi:hypothetical protein